MTAIKTPLTDQQIARLEFIGELEKETPLKAELVHLEGSCLDRFEITYKDMTTSLYLCEEDKDFVLNGMTLERGQ